MSYLLFVKVFFLLVHVIITTIMNHMSLNFKKMIYVTCVLLGPVAREHAMWVHTKDEALGRRSSGLLGHE